LVIFRSGPGLLASNDAFQVLPPESAPPIQIFYLHPQRELSHWGWLEWLYQFPQEALSRQPDETENAFSESLQCGRRMEVLEILIDEHNAFHIDSRILAGQPIPQRIFQDHTTLLGGTPGQDFSCCYTYASVGKGFLAGEIRCSRHNSVEALVYTNSAGQVITTALSITDSGRKSAEKRAQECSKNLRRMVETVRLYNQDHPQSPLPSRIEFPERFLLREGYFRSLFRKPEELCFYDLLLSNPSENRVIVSCRIHNTWEEPVFIDAGGNSIGMRKNQEVSRPGIQIIDVTPTGTRIWNSLYPLTNFAANLLVFLITMVLGYWLILRPFLSVFFGSRTATNPLSTRKSPSLPGQKEFDPDGFLLRNKDAP
jgi:hypothetical protein